MRSLSDILEEYEFLEGDERYRLLIELGRDLEDMPDALKTDATLVRGCSAAVWKYRLVVATGSRQFFVKLALKQRFCAHKATTCQF